jgi:nucleotide-binding universal stress UspA family protein
LIRINPGARPQCQRGDCRSGEVRMYRQVLVPAMLGRPEPDAVRCACALATPRSGRVEVVVGMSAAAPPMAGWQYFPLGVYETLQEEVRGAALVLAGEIRHALAGQSAQVDVRTTGHFWMTPAEQALAHASHSDLVVLGRPRAPTDADAHLFAALLLASGRPVLAVPPGAGDAPRFERIVIAWKATREAARAVHDALPLLRAARRVVVLAVRDNLEPPPSPGGDEPAQALARHLQRHDVDATIVREQRHDRSTGEAIVQYAGASGVDAIVAGGYGHARVLEQVFGGTTRTLYRTSPVPVLFSH